MLVSVLSREQAFVHLWKGCKVASPMQGDIAAIYVAKGLKGCRGPEMKFHMAPFVKASGKTCSFS